MSCALSDIFDVRYGHSLELNALELSDEKNGIAFVSRQSGRNGIAAYVAPIDDVDPAPGEEITCALSGNPLATFLQEKPFYTAFHVAILRPKVPLTKQQILFYCVCIKANRYKYSYGRQANKTLPSLQIPSIDEIPDWVTAADLNTLDNIGLPLEEIKSPQLDTSVWRSYRYDQLFEIGRGLGPRKATLTSEGKTPFVTAIDSNNGLSGYTVESPKHHGNVITVNRNGNGVAEAFYQPAPFSSTEDVHVFIPKFDLNKYIAMFLVPLIRKERYRFNYGRKWGLARMNESTIRLPAQVDGEPDWGFMEKYIKSLPYSKSI